MITTHLALFSFFNGMGAPSSVTTIDTHDGAKYDEEFRRRDEEIREARNRLRDQLRDVVYGVTRKPPPLDASPKELAGIARKSESFDYRGALEEIARLEGAASALAKAREERAADEARVEARRRLRRQEEEALLLLLLH